MIMKKVIFITERADRLLGCPTRPADGKFRIRRALWEAMCAYEGNCALLPLPPAMKKAPLKSGANSGYPVLKGALLF